MNDSRGHSAGDRCLIDVAQLIERDMRPQDIAARMGGDEFVMLLDGVASDVAMLAGDRLRRGLAGLEGGHWGISGSLGLVTLIPKDDGELDRLVARADETMLAAKRAGKNQLMVAALPKSARTK